MKILITSGGTQEAIDQVRSITNHSTGRLGTEIAETFLAAGHSVTLVTTKTAIKPQDHPLLTQHIISNVASLHDCLESLVPDHDALIHSMAVSDYSPVYMTDLDEVQKSEDLEQLLNKQNTESKISSTEDVQVLFLRKTPKIISLVKKWNPAIRLIGFKLLVDVPKAQLVAVARKSLENNQADYIVANDLKEITPDQHISYFVSKDKEEKVTSKKEIAEKLLDILT